MSFCDNFLTIGASSPLEKLPQPNLHPPVHPSNEGHDLRYRPTPRRGQEGAEPVVATTGRRRGACLVTTELASRNTKEILTIVRPHLRKC